MTEIDRIEASNDAADSRFGGHDRSAIAARACTPCRRGAQALMPQDIARDLAHLPDWALLDEGRRIERRFPFKNFAEALAFAVAVGAAAEVEDHHPDIGLGWGWATISWQTHSIGGLHGNDIIMAARTDTLYIAPV